MFRSFRRRRDAYEPEIFWHWLALRAQIRPVVTEGRYDRFVVRVPCWRFTVRRRLRHNQVKFAFMHLIDERIRDEIVEPGGVSEDTIVLGCRNAEERHSVQRRLVDRWGATIFEWHRITHS